MRGPCACAAFMPWERATRITERLASGGSRCHTFQATMTTPTGLRVNIRGGMHASYGVPGA